MTDMALSLWILADWLSSVSPAVECQTSRIEIVEVRLYKPGMHRKDNTVYLGQSDMFFHDGDSRIVCVHRANCLRLQTEDLLDVSNRIQDAFSFYSKWKNTCMEAIADQCGLSELLDLSADIFHMPILIVDAAQTLVARSSNIAAFQNIESWKPIFKYESASAERLKYYNKICWETLDQEEVFPVTADFFPAKSYCKHIFFNRERMATVILKVTGEDCSIGLRHLLEILTLFVQKWIQKNTASGESPVQMISFLAQALSGKTNALQTLLRQLALFGWQDNCRKQMIVTSAVSEQLRCDLHLFLGSDNTGLGTYMIDYQGKMVLLCNLDMLDDKAFFHSLCAIFQKNGCYGAASFCFTDIKLLSSSYFYLMTTLEHCEKEVGKLYHCQEIAMQCAAETLSKHAFGMLLHPALAAIKEYDVQHNTDYYQTLFCFLRNERRHQATADELFIHRNTLFQRLQKLQEMWPLNLEDGGERFYLLFSFYQEQYAGRNTVSP